VVAVNAALTKAEATKVAQMAHNGLARTVFPAHTRLDGDTIFTVATGVKRVSVDYLGVMAVKVMEMAIIKAIQSAKGVAGIPSYQDLRE
jgi:L-aminopeptidase/D-esterase-like protein